jgi:hypothetical protein
MSIFADMTGKSRDTLTLMAQTYELVRAKCEKNENRVELACRGYESNLTEECDRE